MLQHNKESYVFLKSYVIQKFAVMLHKHQLKLTKYAISMQTYRLIIV